ncbi:DUF1801 domain-containing protein [Aquabacterium sp.]|uniref:DUF1801 domain-containing protein n=1 Tax=Aquabacterium sp. TaxID=1872578 RepID=UPI00378483B5
MPEPGAFLRFDGAVRHEPAIDRWLDSRPPALGAIARAWFARMRACGDSDGQVRELMHDGAPTACVGDAAFGYVNVYRAHVNVGFFHGHALADPAGLLQGSGRFMRHVKLRPGEAVDEAALAALITAAHADIRSRLRA